MCSLLNVSYFSRKVTLVLRQTQAPILIICLNRLSDMMGVTRAFSFTISASGWSKVDFQKIHDRWLQKELRCTAAE